MRNKIFMGAFLFLVTFGVVIFGTYNYFNEKDAKPDLSITEEVEKAEPAKFDEKAFREQTKKIEGVELTTGLNKKSTEKEVIEVMHKMTHQKIRANDKWGAIPMTEQSIKEVTDVVENSEDFTFKIDLDKILAKWNDGDFSQIDRNHNSVWNFEGGTAGKAFGIMTDAEEQEFIKNNFNSQKD